MTVTAGPEVDAFMAALSQARAEAAEEIAGRLQDAGMPEAAKVAARYAAGRRRHDAL